MTPGAELLLGLLRGEGPLPGAADARWPETLALAERHGVAPLLHEQLPGLCAPIRARLREARIAALREHQKQERALQDALRALPDAVVFKGAAYARNLYIFPELRPAGDVDLFHPDAPGELPGFDWHEETQQHEQRRGWHERTLVHRETGVQVDLHRAFAQAERNSLDPRQIFARSNKNALDADDAVIIHAHNLALHELRAPLIQLVDLELLLARCRPERVLQRARESHTLNALCAALALLERVRPGAPEELLREARPTLAVRWAVRRYDVSRRPLRRAEQLLRKAVFIDRARDRARFLFAHLRARR